MGDEELAQVLGECADAALELGHHRGAVVGHRQRERQAGGAARCVGPAVGGVDGQKREHPAHDRVLVLVGQVSVDHVHRRPEQHFVNRPAFGVVGCAGIHLVEGLGRFANVEAAERPCGSLTPADQFGHAGDGLEAVLLAEVRHQLHRVAVEDHRLFAVFADVGRHHVRFHRGQRVESEILGDLACRRELHRTRDLVSEAVDQFDRRRHAARVGVGFQAHGAQARRAAESPRRSVRCARHPRRSRHSPSCSSSRPVLVGGQRVTRICQY